MERQEAEASFSFRKGTRVILQGLIKTAQLNGTKGVVISEFSKGRYPVSIEGLGDFRIKRSNLRNEVSVESLSIKDLKTILVYKKEQKFIASATENSELQAKVLEFITSSEELPELLVNVRASKKTTDTSVKCGLDSTIDEPVPMDIDDPIDDPTPRPQKRRRTSPAEATESTQPQYFGPPNTL